MSSEHAIPFDELEQRRKKVAERKASQAQQPQPEEEEPESEAMALLNDIFNPRLKLPKITGPYKPPEEMTAQEMEEISMEDLDIRKLAELKEVFSLFDTDCDGLISKDDLRFTCMALGGDENEEQLEEMLQEAKDPLDYDAFVELMSHRTVELDPEDVLLEAWCKFDDYGSGKIDHQKMYIELTNYGDKLTISEADEVFRHAPLAKPKTLEDPPMIDYPAFCRMLSGMRKRKPDEE